MPNSPNCSNTIITLQKSIEKIYSSTTLNLLEDNIIDEDYPPPPHQQEEKNIKLIKEQQDLTKITIKDSTNLLAKKLKIPHLNNSIDKKIINSALLDLKKLRRLALKEKIEHPLNLQKTLKEKDIKNLKTLKKIIKKQTSQIKTNI